jgi:hypothetical protein
MVRAGERRGLVHWQTGGEVARYRTHLEDFLSGQGRRGRSSVVGLVEERRLWRMVVWAKEKQTVRSVSIEGQ